MPNQTRDEIMAKLEATVPKRGGVEFNYESLLLELILDVLVDIRDAMPTEPVEINIKNDYS